MATPLSTESVKKSLPDAVIEITNEAIQEAWDGNRAVVKQDHLVSRLVKALRIERGEIFSKKYLDIESVYQGVGWKVEYHSPAYNDTPFEPYFIFSKA